MQCMGVGDKAFSLPQTIYNPTAPTSPSYFVYLLLNLSYVYPIGLSKSDAQKGNNVAGPLLMVTKLPLERRKLTQASEQLLNAD